MGKGDEINKRGKVEGEGGNGRKRDSCHKGNANGIWRTRKRGEMTSADFSRSKADVVLTPGCVNSTLLVILPDRYENRVILHLRNDRSQSFLRANTNFQIFSFDFTSLLDYIDNEHSFLLYINKIVFCTFVSQVQKNPGNLSLLCSRKSGTPESDFPAR